MQSWLLNHVQPYDSPEEVMVLVPNTQRYEFTQVFSSSMLTQSSNFPSLSSSIFAVFGFLYTILPVLPFGCCGALGSPGTAATSSGASPGQVHISTGQSGGVFPQLMRHQASDDDKLMAEHQDASTTVLIDSLWCVGIMMYAAAQASMLRTCTAWRGGMPSALCASRGAAAA